MRRQVLWWAGGLLLVGSLAVVAQALDADALRRTAQAALSQPLGMLVAVCAYAAAFLIRAWLWRRVVPDLPLGQALAALYVSLGGNHVLPLRLGEALRVTSVVRRTDIALAPATASTILLRAGDVLAVVALAAVLGPRVLVELAGPWAWAVPPVVVAAAVVGVAWLRRLRTARGTKVRVPGPLIVAVALIAWVLEATVLWQAATWAGVAIDPLDAVFVTAVTIAAQTFAVTPGGVGTYEAAATAALVALGADSGAALAAAVAAHAVKTAYALVTGAVALVVPAPGMFGRLRLRAPSATPAICPTVTPDSPVVLFLPAHNEEATVAAVVRRAPAAVAGRRVEVLVVDDGSTDGTAVAARAAGAAVVTHWPNRGLGAAVRTGFAEARRRDAAAVAFCDADGEYAPEELEQLVAPILRGDADYVVGSRFAGRIERMRPHRRIGNLTLTVLLSFVARRRISDGQSGYRALSPAAAADAEIIHDFNYAQVLTLDLLAKGYRYAEVPISYGFRQHGESFIRLGRYLRAVVPAVHRELNTT
jgi:uncharacterized membrane protein YbhN (UPF0104 family)